MADFAGDPDDAFTAGGGSLVEKLFRQVRRIKYGLRAPLTIAHVNEDKTAEIPPRVHPACQRHRLADVLLAQLVTMMRSFHPKERGCCRGRGRNSKRILSKLNSPAQRRIR